MSRYEDLEDRFGDDRYMPGDSPRERRNRISRLEYDNEPETEDDEEEDDEEDEEE
jgi:hypothetical protein